MVMYLFTTACGGSPTPVGSTDQESTAIAAVLASSNTDTGSTTDAASTTTDVGGLDGPGLIVIGCSSETTLLSRLDPTTMAVMGQLELQPQRSVEGLGDVITQLDCSSRYFSSDFPDFSSDFRYVVAATQEGIVDERHVGVIDTTTNTFIDVTEATRPTGFSASSPYDQNPYISNGNLYWVRNREEVWSYDIEAKVGSVIPGEEPNLEVQVGQTVISPNGTLAARTSCPLGFRGCPEGNLYVYPVDVTDSSEVKAIVVNDNIAASVNPLTWVDEERILVQSGYHWDSNIEVLDTSAAPSGMATTLTSTYLLPQNNHVNRNPVASPDGKEIVFRSWDDKGQMGIYKTTIDGNGQPQELDVSAALPVNASDFNLIDWR